MFVQVASGSKSSDGVLTLSGVSPATLYFSDRPERVVGHMTNEQFVEGWSLGDRQLRRGPSECRSVLHRCWRKPTGGLRCRAQRTEDRHRFDSILVSAPRGFAVPIIGCVHSVHRPSGTPALAGLNCGDASSAAKALAEPLGCWFEHDVRVDIVGPAPPGAAIRNVQ